MRKMMILAMGLLIAVGAAAQKGPGKGRKNGPPSPEKRAEKVTAWMKSTLNLNADQEIKVKAINLEAARGMLQLKQDSLMDQTKRREQHKVIANKRKEELKKVLTPDQWTLLQQKVKEKRMAKKAARGNPGAPAGKGPELSDEELDAIID